MSHSSIGIAQLWFKFFPRSEEYCCSSQAVTTKTCILNHRSFQEQVCYVFRHVLLSACVLVFEFSQSRFRYRDKSSCLLSDLRHCKGHPCHMSQLMLPSNLTNKSWNIRQPPCTSLPNTGLFYPQFALLISISEPLEYMYLLRT